MLRVFQIETFLNARVKVLFQVPIQGDFYIPI